MNHNDLLLAIKLVEDYQSKRLHHHSTTISTGFEQIEAWGQKQALHQKHLLTEAAGLVEKFAAVQATAAELNKATSGDFNLFRMIHINEPTHSFLLAHLLNPNADHGQGHLFLNVFLDMLGIARSSDHEHWTVTPEKGRIDIRLKRVHPHAVVVIENKSNHARDQDHQLYRYWYQEIYQTICEAHLGREYILNPPGNRYQLVYLTPEHWKIPTDNSLCKPPDWDNDLPAVVPIPPKVLLIREFVTDWLKQSLNKLPPANYRLREYVKQYIEFWI
jgi:hypothetical protein